MSLFICELFFRSVEMLYWLLKGERKKHITTGMLWHSRIAAPSGMKSRTRDRCHEGFTLVFSFMTLAEVLQLIAPLVMADNWSSTKTNSAPWVRIAHKHFKMCHVFRLLWLLSICSYWIIRLIKDFFFFFALLGNFPGLLSSWYPYFISTSHHYRPPPPPPSIRALFRATTVDCTTGSSLYSRLLLIIKAFLKHVVA